MEKVTLPKEVAEAIEELRKGDKAATIVSNHAHGWGATKIELKDVNLDTLIRALYIGYEVEQTPEDKIKESIEECKQEIEELEDHPEAKWWTGRRNGILDTLNTLGIKISGVNAE